MKDVQDAINYKQMSCAVSVIKHTDGSLTVITTDGDTTEIIGAIEICKNIVYQDRFHNDDN